MTRPFPVIVKTVMIPLMVQYQMSVGSTETAEELRVGPVMFGIPMTFPVKSEITVIPVALGVGQLYLKLIFLTLLARSSSYRYVRPHLPDAGTEYRNNVRQTVSQFNLNV